MQALGVAAWQMHQTHHSGLTFDQGGDRRAVVVANDQVAFPVASLRSVIDRERTVVDGEHRLLKPWSSALLTLVRAAVIAAGTQG